MSLVQEVEETEGEVSAEPEHRKRKVAYIGDFGLVRTMRSAIYLSDTTVVEVARNEHIPQDAELIIIGCTKDQALMTHAIVDGYTQAKVVLVIDHYEQVTKLVPPPDGRRLFHHHGVSGLHQTIHQALYGKR